MFVVVNPNQGNLLDPTSVVVRKGCMGLSFPAYVLDESNLGVASYSEEAFRSRFGDCHDVRNVELADDGSFLRVTGDDPYSSTDTEVSCADGFLVIAPGGRSFKVNGREFTIKDEDGFALNDKQICSLSGDVKSHIMYAFKRKSVLYMRFMVYCGSKLGIVSVIFTESGLIRDTVGYGVCNKKADYTDGRRLSFTDVTSRY